MRAEVTPAACRLGRRRRLRRMWRGGGVRHECIGILTDHGRDSLPRLRARCGHRRCRRTRKLAEVRDVEELRKRTSLIHGSPHCEAVSVARRAREQRSAGPRQAAHAQRRSACEHAICRATDVEAVVRSADGEQLAIRRQRNAEHLSDRNAHARERARAVRTHEQRVGGICRVNADVLGSNVEHVGIGRIDSRDIWNAADGIFRRRERRAAVIGAEDDGRAIRDSGDVHA